MDCCVYSDISDDDSSVVNKAGPSAVDEAQQQQKHRAFAEEAFTYLLDRFEIGERSQGKLRYFSNEAGQAVVTIAYVYRRRLRTLFRSATVDFADVEEFKKFVRNFELIEDEIYFYRILKRISHIFELVVHCMGQGHDHTGAAREIDLFVDSSDKYFLLAGGMDRLNLTAAFVADAGIVLHAVIRDEKPQDETLRSFVAVVEALENLEGAEMPPAKRGPLSMIKAQLRNKFPDADDLDVRVARFFYKVICQRYTSQVIAASRGSKNENMYRRQKYHVGVEREKLAIIESLRIAVRIIFGDTEFSNSERSVQAAECFAALRHLTDLLTPVLVDPQAAIPEHVIPNELSEDERKCYSVKECFVVSRAYIEQYPEDFFEQPSAEKLHRKKLREVLYANLRQGNRFPLNDGSLVVHTPDCRFDETTTTVLFS